MSSHVQGLLHGKSFLCESHFATVDTIKSVGLCHFAHARRRCHAFLNFYGSPPPRVAQTLPCVAYYGFSNLLLIPIYIFDSLCLATTMSARSVLDGALYCQICEVKISHTFSDSDSLDNALKSL